MNKIELNSENNLEEKVVEILNGYLEQEYETEKLLEDILYHGCQSGMISELIYYHDTILFFEEFKTEIKKLLNGFMNETGLRLQELFSNWDNEDIFCEETNNQNILAWFGFEETCRIVANKLGYDF